MDLKETTARLRVRLNKALRMMEKAERRPLENKGEPKGEPVELQPNPPMKLPKLNLPVFDCNLLHWQEFWDILTLQFISRIFLMLPSLAT